MKSDKHDDKLYTPRVYMMLVEDLFAGYPEGLAAAADYLKTDKGYSKERLQDFFCDTLGLANRLIKRKNKKKQGKVITLVNEIVLH